MARPRYPSDDRRLRPHAKVHLTIRHHPSYAGIFADPEMRGMVVGLWVIAVEYQAARTDDLVTLTDADLQWITGRTQRRHALSSMRALCELMSYSMSEHPRHVVVHVRNLQRKQGLTPRLRCGTSATPSASDSDSDSEYRVRKKPPPLRGVGGVVVKDEAPGRPPDPQPTGGDLPLDLQPARGEKSAPDDPDEIAAFEAFDHLTSAIVQSIPGQRTPKPGSAGERAWAAVLRKLADDGQSANPRGWGWEQIFAVIRWLPTHERRDFRWGKVVLSPASLRKHFPRLLDEMLTAQAAAKPHVYEPPPVEVDLDLEARRSALQRLKDRSGDANQKFSISAIEEEMNRYESESGSLGTPAPS